MNTRCRENPRLTWRKKGRTAWGPKHDPSFQRTWWSESGNPRRKLNASHLPLTNVEPHRGVGFPPVRLSFVVCRWSNIKKTRFALKKKHENSEILMLVGAQSCWGTEKHADAGRIDSIFIVTINKTAQLTSRYKSAIASSRQWSASVRLSVRRRPISDAAPRVNGHSGMAEY